MPAQNTKDDRKIKPRYNINGQGYYRLTDIGGPGTLLRASAQSNVTPDTLLRPTTAHSETASEQLLRAKE